MKTITLLFIISLLLYGAVTDETVSVMEGDLVTLNTNIVIQKDDLIEWRFGAHLDLIAKLNKEANKISLSSDERFTDRLKMNEQNGDLTITNITSEHTGVYQIEITGKKVTTKTFNVTGLFTDEVKSVSAKEGDSVTLRSDLSDIKNYDVIRWRFQGGSSSLAELNRRTSMLPKYDVSDRRFTDRLQLDQTGSLTNTNVKTEHSGLYEVDFSSSTNTIHRSYTVSVSDEVKPVSIMEGDSVTLHTDLPGIQRGDVIEWRFHTHASSLFHMEEYGIIINSEDYSSLSDDEERFRDGLQVDAQTGSLTITDSRNEYTGLYELKITNRRRSIQRRFIVTVSALGLSKGAVAGILVTVLLLIAITAAAAVSYLRRCFPKARLLEVMKGHQVILHSDFIMKPDDVIQWRFGLQRTLIAEVKNSNHMLHEDALDGRFRGRLTLRDTGSLTISDTRTTDSGVYQLKIINSTETSYKRFRLNVTNSSLVNETLVVRKSLIEENNPQR